MQFDWHPPSTVSSLAGYAGTAFLMGIALHSFWPYRSFDHLLLTFLIVGAIALLAFFWSHARLRCIAFCVLGMALGVWRFDMIRPSLPRGLIPFSSRGLAFLSVPRSLSPSQELSSWLGRGRKFFTGRAQQLFTPNEAALLTGILYGERQFSPTLKEQFRRAGLLHIVAVSGSNVTIIVALLMPIFLAFRLSRKIAFVFLSTALFLFVLFVNPYASVVRAALMGWLLELAPLVGRIPRPSRLLLVAAVVFVAWQPWGLFYDASFALSFLAMWGLLTWTPWFQEHLERVIPWSFIRQTTATTLGATLMTIPYTAWAFRQVTLFGLLTGLLALPLVPWIMILGILSLLLPSIIFILPARGFLDLILVIARIPNLFPFGTWSKLSTPGWVMLGAYALLYAIWLFVQRKKRLIHGHHAFFSKKMSTTDRLSDEFNKK
ncbi:MAG: ComEC/Rec2 family competence protein [Candidatus Uhrbacteria bacterium]|nr:ComEC/Rec2 family competence protein [Candidatus Uhrbacteria bacterium]